MLKKLTRGAAVTGAVVLASATLAACSSGIGGSSEGITLRLASPLPAAGPHGETLESWADDVAEASGGEIKIEIFPGGSLLSGEEALAGAQDGRADLVLAGSSYHRDEMPLWNMVSVPFQAQTWTATAHTMSTLLEESAVFSEEFESHNVKPLFSTPNGSASSGDAGPVGQLKDMHGKRYRVPGTLGDLVSGAGIDPVFLEFPELYEGVQRGVVDGWIGTELASAVSASLEEVTPHFTDPGLGQYISTMVLVNLDRWGSLSDEQRQVLSDVSAEYPGAMVDRITELETEACDTILESGGTFTALSDGDVDALAGDAPETIREELRSIAEDRGVEGADFDEFADQFKELMSEFVDSDGYVDGQTACAERS